MSTRSFLLGTSLFRPVSSRLIVLLVFYLTQSCLYLKTFCNSDKWGRITALKDREGVRGFPLSLGLSNQRTRALESPYDAYRYDSDGKLVAIPSMKTEHPWGKEIDSTLRIPKYHVAEADGYIWIWTGKKAPEEEPLTIPGVADYIWNQETLMIDADPTLCLQLEMDWASSYTQNRMQWAHRRAVLPFKKSITLERPFEVRSTETGFELITPPTKSPEDTKPRQAITSAFSLPDRVVHQKLLKRRFWRGFGDFVSVAHFVPIIDPITKKITTRAEYMWTPLILPGYAFQRNKLATLPASISKFIPSYRKHDKATLEILQHNINHWNAVDALDVNPHFMTIEASDAAAATTTVDTTAAAAAASSSSSSSSSTISDLLQSRSLVLGAASPCFGPDVPVDSPSSAVFNVLQLAASDSWNAENAKIIVPEGRQVGTFRAAHVDS